MQNIPSTTRVALKYGLFTAAAYLVLGIFAGVLAGMSDLLVLINLIVFSAGISYGMLEFRRANDDTMSYLQGLNIGMIISTIAGLCLGVLSAASIALTDPKYISQAKEIMLKNFKAQDYTEESLKGAKMMLHFIFTPTGSFIMTLFAWVLVGTIITLLMSFFMRQNASKF